jgi:L-fuculose-phosphate aldolase
VDDAEYALRKAIIDTCLAMNRGGLNQGTSGNVSARWQKGLLITPSGIVYDALSPEDIVFLAMDGTPAGPHKPSSEWRFHRDILKARKDVNAIVHAHPVHCTAVAICRKDIPAVHYMIAAAGGPTVRCAPYATFGTEELSKNAVAALTDRLACLLANHGLIACGANLRKALWLAIEMETLARQFILAQAAGEPVVLPDEEIARCVELFRGYGPQSKAA